MQMFKINFKRIIEIKFKIGINQRADARIDCTNFVTCSRGKCARILHNQIPNFTVILAILFYDVTLQEGARKIQFKTCFS